MHALASTALALSLAAPDPRTIDPDASRPDIVTAGGGDTAPSPVVTPPGSAAGPAPVIPDRPPAPGSPKAAAPSQPTASQPAAPNPPAAVAAEPAATRTDPNVDRTQTCFAARGRCRRLSVAGYSTLAVAVAMLGAGIAFTLIEPFPIDEDPVSVRSLAPVGRAMVGVGAVGVVGGALLIGAGIAVHRKFRSGEERLAKVRLDARGLHW